MQEFVEPINTKFSKEIISNQSTENKPNYNSFKVDETEPHNLDEDFKNKRPVGFLLEGKRYSVRNWNRLLVMVCEILNKQNLNLFKSFPDDESMQGRTRTYFSRKQMKYACKKVGGTDIYVLTNNNGNGNCSIIIKMLEKYNIPTTSMEIFLKADCSPLHGAQEDEEPLKKQDKSEIENNMDVKIGQYAKEYFTQYFSDTTKQYNLKNFLIDIGVMIIWEFVIHY